MKLFNEYQNVYFVGIGGIGMSALARFFSSAGQPAGGYDRVQSPVTDALQSEGINVVFDSAVEAVPDDFRDKERTLVIYTPAVPAMHPQLSWFKENGFKVLKRSRVLGMITDDMWSVCVAGTHGKTTVSTLTAFLLHNCRPGVNAFLGGISRNFNTNFIGNGDSQVVVLEADEFDRSFWQLNPSIGLITSMDADHLDIYGTIDEVRKGFEGFAQRIKAGGKLIIKSGLPVPSNLQQQVEVFTYSMYGDADYTAVNVEAVNGYYHFDLKTPEGTIEGFRMGTPGLLNVENAVAALTLARMSGAGYHELIDALPNFRGIARRFDVLINTSRLVYVDDYAHHPQEIRATLQSIRDMWPGRLVTGIFQPHLYSRTRDFAKAFAEALDNGLHRIVLLPVYPAREEPIPGVSSETISRYIDRNKCTIVEKDELIPYLNNFEPDVLITMGAGDIDRLVPGICEWGYRYIKNDNNI
jgi:UDP-N-acetylmuramate--alanine ligase